MFNFFLTISRYRALHLIAEINNKHSKNTFDPDIIQEILIQESRIGINRKFHLSITYRSLGLVVKYIAKLILILS